jgi:hypothetical protein
MHKCYNDFIEAINKTKLVSIACNSYEKGIIRRKCIPFDFGLSNKYKDGLNRFHFLDLDSPDGKHNLSILPEQLFDLSILDEIFNPADYIWWAPKWHIARDWGKYS